MTLIEAIQKLVEHAESTQDEGPAGAGWKSDKLNSAIDRANEWLAQQERLQNYRNGEPNA